MSTEHKPHSDPVECDGSADCKAETHILGCFAGPKESNQHSEPRLAISNALVHAYAPSNAMYREAMYALDGIFEQVETLRREQTALDGESVRLNRENRELKEQFDAAVEALRDIERAGHTGPNALTREGFYARAVLERLSASNPTKEPEEPRLRAAVLYLTDSNQDSEQEGA